MRPEVWVPAAATLAAPLVPTIASWVVRTFRGDERPASAPSRPRRLAALAAIPAAAAVWLAPNPWNWIAAAVYMLALATVFAWSWLRAVRHPTVLPEAQRLLKDGARRAPGFEYDRDFLPDLVRVYTTNDLARERGAQEPANPDKPQESASEQRVSFERIIVDPKVRHIAITGEAGIGKTFMLRYWEHDLRHRAPAAADPVSKYRPLLVSARRLVGCASISEAFGEVGDDALEHPPGKGLSWLVMIDAFDEITDAADRAEVERLVFESIEDATKHDRARKFVITTRGLTDDRRRSFESRGVTEFVLQVFTSEQLHAFLVNAETSIPDRETRSPAHVAAVAKADRFLKRWEDEDDLLELFRLPLLARVAATVYFQNRHLELPSRRVDVYHDAIEHWIAQFHKRMDAEREQHGPALRLLKAWHRSEGDPGAEATDAAVRDLLRRLAVRYLESDRRSVVGIACDLMELQVRPKDPGQLEALVTLLEATGLIHDVRTVGSHFVHKSYAEYLAAPATLDRYPDPVAWNAAFRDPERRIAAIFAFAQVPHAERVALIDAMRQDPECVYALGWIAAEGLCVVQGTGRIDHEVRNALIGTVVQGWPPYPQPDWWLLVNGLCAVGHTRDLLHRQIQEGRFSDSDRLQVCAALARHDFRGIASLRAFAEEGGSPWTRARAADELVEFDRPFAIATLEEIAADMDMPDGVRYIALSSLTRDRPSTAIPLLRDFALDTGVQAESRASAAGAMIEHDADASAMLLKQLMNEFRGKEFAPVSPAIFLCDIDADEATNELRDLVANRGIAGFQRVRAAAALARQDRKAGIARLRELSEDPTIEIWGAINALRELREHEDRAEVERRLLAIKEDSTLDYWDRMHAARTFALEGWPVDTAMLESIADDPTIDEYVRVGALDDLIAVDQARIIARLQNHAIDPGSGGHERVTAALYVSNWNFQLGVTLLESILAEPSAGDHVRQRALHFLLGYGQRHARPRLLALAEDPTATAAARIAAVDSLMPRLGGHGLAILRHLAEDTGLLPEDRVEAVTGLVRYDLDEDPERLGDLADDAALHEDARLKAATELARYHPSKAATSLRRIATATEVSDDARTTAACELVALDLATAIPLLIATAEDADADDESRVSAAKAVAKIDMEHGCALLLPLAKDKGLCHSNAVEAAHLLRKYGDARGLDLTIAYTTCPDLDDQARVRAAATLLESDRGLGTARLAELASDDTIDDVAQTDAALKLAGLDREAGLASLRRTAALPLSLGGRTAYATKWIARFRPEEGTPLLHAMAANEDDPGSTRAHAAQFLTERDRGAGLPILRRLAEGRGCDPYAAELAARYLRRHDRPAAAALLHALMEDTSASAFARVEAADDLPAANLSEAVERLRRFTDDPAFDGLGRAAAALNLSFCRKREGLDRLRALMADPDLDETERLWAAITLACRDAEARASLAGRRVEEGSVDFGRLHEAADNAIKLNLRTGYQVRRFAIELEAASGASSMHE
ncbi:NACHT domain-containing protein [Glycomyces paridis]|uniref:NACHT domain-containing protein n=1 Tax=Glycomyces paridis TaxID=2126555 RepID=A0A4S8PJ87_9ACTN|nr:hypothetical protein [Glycomyces paridis]THV28364.1 hypothetical protein E9998_12205 [Glycomyces paridis]